MVPTASQTTSSQNGEASDLAMPAGVRKMPTAIASPATAAAAEPRPSRRRRASVVGCGDSECDGTAWASEDSPGFICAELSSASARFILHGDRQYAESANRRNMRKLNRTQWGNFSG